jgi:hypothetical protein
MTNLVHQLPETAPAPLRIETKSRFWSTTFPRIIAPMIVVCLVLETLFMLVTNPPHRNPGAFVAFLVRCVVVVGLVIVAFNARRRVSSDVIEFSDRLRFINEGVPIAFDWNQISGLWYEGVRNPARVNVLTASTNAMEDRVLVVGITRGVEVRSRVAPEVQPRVLQWAQFIDRVRRSS